MTRDADLTGVRGAVYVPARVFNAHHLWAEYDPDVTERDLDYAVRLGLNAIRVFASFEYWQADRAGFAEGFDHLLASAADRGVAVLPILFESAGEDPTDDALADRDPTTACAVRSPSGAVIRNEPDSAGTVETLRRVVGGGRDRWDAPRAFVAWFADRYGDDDRLLALEIMNEPGGWDPRVAFARDMLRTADEHRGRVPLTMGSKSLENDRLYEDPPLDVYQFHYNDPPTADDMAAALSEAATVAEREGVPVWLTEWQRTQEEPPDTLLPHYASLAPTIRESDVDGDFLWSLLVKPAYLPKPRSWGRINGVFHEDGRVFSAEDARAIAGDDGLDVEEHGAVPDWIPASVSPTP